MTEGPGQRLRLGLIADTHGLLRPQALDALQGVDGIIHAGDAGSPQVLEALRRVAPLTAVRGNVDRGAWSLDLPATAELEVGGHWLHVLHILEDLDLDPRAAGFAAVIYGHSHRPTIERRNGILYINPGSAGPRRFKLPVTLALLEVRGTELRPELVSLEE